VQAYWEANLAYCAEIIPRKGWMRQSEKYISLAFVADLR
jgi:hypothetical protein